MPLLQLLLLLGAAQAAHHHSRQLRAFKLPHLKLPVMPGLVSSSSSSSNTTSTGAGASLEPSSAIASGFALNGGKAAAHAKASVRPHAGAAATANATAVANHASRAVAKSTSTTSNRAGAGSALARSDATAVADSSSAALADSATVAVGLGGSSTLGDTSTRSAATDSSHSVVAGTTVSSAVRDGSSTHVVSDAAGAASQHSNAVTRADSIAVAYDQSRAAGNATSRAHAGSHGMLALSHSLMESFAVFKASNTLAGSLADARATKWGLAASRDKAVGIGVVAANATTNTTSAVSATKLGLGVIDSVIRSITAQGRLACADALNKAVTELASTGPLLDTSIVILHVGSRAPQQCLQHFKDLAAKAAASAQPAPPAGAGGLAGAPAGGVQPPGFEQLVDEVLQGAQPGMSQAAGAVDLSIGQVASRQG